MKIVLAVTLMIVCGLAKAGAAYQEPGITDTLFVTDQRLTFGTAMAWAPDGTRRLFIARKDGEVRVIKEGAVLATPWATMSPIITPSECGLLGICFDPNFLSNGYVYLFVTVSTSEQQILRYTDNASTNVGGNRTVLIPGLPTTGNNHNGGCINIGPDGKLYWAIGNLSNSIGTPITRGENGDVSNLASKVGRANLDGSAPFDNPFYDGTGPNNDRVWTRGLRNPFKFTFQPATGKLWVNCVGDSFEQTFVMNKGEDAGDRARENIQTGSLITPLIKYRTNTVANDTKTIAANGAIRSNNVVTFTTTATHGYRKGENVTLAGVTDVSFNAQFFVASVPSATTFTVAQAGANATSGNGTATPLQISTGTSAAVTAACFYDSTLFGAQFRNNFFFGDVASGRIIRSTLDTDNSVKTVTYFASGAQQIVDMVVGPDGAMYYMGHSGSGSIFRMVPSTIAPGIIVSPGNLRLLENASAMVSVSLATAPAGTVQVAVQRASGDSDVTVSPATLTFTAATFNVPQVVTVLAAKDADISDDTANLSFTSGGLTTESVLVTAIDIDASSVVLSSSAVTIVEGQTNSFTVALPAQPVANVTVSLVRTGDTDVTITSSATLTFTNANWNMPQTVMLAAAADADTTNDSATITLSGTGLSPSTVSVTVTDNTANSPQFTSTPVTAGVVGAQYLYDANASGTPSAAFSLTTQPNGMSINFSSGLISWIPAAVGNFDVTVVASNGNLPNATQSFTIVVVADQPPTAQISKPVQNEIISGTNTEFYGNGVDDVATVRGEFYVDNVLRFTDNSPGDHYHIFGSHLLFDTTIYANGPHTLKMIVYDAAGMSGSQEIVVTIQNAGPVIQPVVTGGSANGTVGQAFSFQIVASNSPLSYSATGLPEGLHVNPGTGIISGSPMASGSFAVQMSATNGAGTGSAALALTIAPGPAGSISPVVQDAQAAGRVGVAFSFQIVGTQNPTSFGATGLPGGLSVSQSGLIAGTPNTVGVFSVTMSATNAAGTGSGVLTLTISANRAPVFSSGISVAPQPLFAGVEAALTVVAADADGDAVSIAWNFGDGSTGTGASVLHTFAISGMYQLQAVASDPFANATSSLLLPVFPKPSDVEKAQVLIIKKASLKLNFKTPSKRDHFSVAGSVPTAEKFEPNGASVAVRVGAFGRSYILDKRGSSADKKFKLQGNGRGGALKFSLVIDGADLALFASEFPNATVAAPGKIVQLPVSIALGGKFYIQLLTVKYTAIAGKSGSAK